MTDDLTANRTYKDTLFRALFNEKEAALALYNAINGTNYDNPDDVSITTLKDALYIDMKNDVSCMIYNTMNLYEHQSTYNPNMPLRGLFYLADLYRGYIVKNKLDIFSSARLRLPYPRYVVFYNGTETRAEREMQKLSDSFFPQENEAPVLELTCIVLNINRGYNRNLMEKCKILDEYSQLIARIRFYTDSGLQLEEAIRRAIHDCIENNVLADYLRENSEVVRQMLLEEMDLKAIHEESERRIWQEKGLQEGLSQGLAQGLSQGLSQGLTQGLTQGLSQGLTQGDSRTLVKIIASIMEKKHVTLEEACDTAGYTTEEYQAAKKILAKLSDS